jgi:ribosomal protein L40E
MAKKTLGYAELYWVCPNCEGINPGPEKTCNQCGAPQPEDVEFQQADRLELLEDDHVKDKVAAGPDIHCPYCNTRNPGNAKVCTQCGGDISEGTRRESGKVVGAFQTGPTQEVSCPHCGATNLDTATNCAQCGGSMHIPKEKAPSETSSSQPLPKKKSPLALVIIFVALCCIAAVFLFFIFRTEETTGTVDEVHWERSIAIEAIIPVEYSTWEDQIPADAEVLSCNLEVRSVESEPVAGAEEVCGTPYNVDTGSGYAEVVQDCEYHVYDSYCSYSVLEWQPVDSATRSGEGFSPVWPDPALDNEQRLGAYTESYTVYFDTDSGDYPYSVSDFETFQQFETGSEWILEINSFGVVSVSK